ncbi:hypothetical protein A0H81_14963 [Grifola frondosa]|uniref:Uncharacterized protein n=1 Tax=Grifola frondosa TaxID=5627 RepID=A0A1C7LLZ2_GRIFR|nr:hypothetical protein A0H81_14963 [Grifola frondosa]
MGSALEDPLSFGPLMRRVAGGPGLQSNFSPWYAHAAGASLSLAVRVRPDISFFMRMGRRLRLHCVSWDGRYPRPKMPLRAVPVCSALKSSGAADYQSIGDVIF